MVSDCFITRSHASSFRYNAPQPSPIVYNTLEDQGSAKYSASVTDFVCHLTKNFLMWVGVQVRPGCPAPPPPPRGSRSNSLDALCCPHTAAHS